MLLKPSQEDGREGEHRTNLKNNTTLHLFINDKLLLVGRLLILLHKRGRLVSINPYGGFCNRG